VKLKERDKRMTTKRQLEKRQIKAMAKAQLRFDNDWYKASTRYLKACDKAKQEYDDGIKKLAKGGG